MHFLESHVLGAVWGAFRILQVVYQTQEGLK